MEKNTENNVNVLNDIFKMAETNLVQAKEMMRDAKVTFSDLGVLMECLKYINSSTAQMELAIDLAIKIPVEELELGVLMEWLKSDSRDARGLVVMLTMSISDDKLGPEIDVLTKCLESRNPCVHLLANVLLFKLGSF